MNKKLVWLVALLIVPLFLMSCIGSLFGVPKPGSPEFDAMMMTQTVRDAVQRGDGQALEGLAELREADAEYSHSPAGGVDIYKDGFQDGIVEGVEDTQKDGFISFLLGALGIVVFLVLVYAAARVRG